jgi:adenosine kinase
MSVLICGSYAYDHIMVFPDRFKNHILPDKVHMINVSFLVPQMRREFGGTAGNIAYNLNALGEPALPMATVGMDFSAYSHWMQQCGVDERHITIVDEQYTGQAFITTDMDDNQITAFHPGAMSESHRNTVGDAQGIVLGIVSPDGRQGMIDHATQFVEAGIPFIFDPGQGMPMFDGNDLTQFVDQATWVAVNDYESALLSERTGLSLEQLAERVHGLIVTKGGEGSQIYANGGCIEIPPVAVEAPVDPTGCGDAYRAGLLFGLRNDLDWETTGRVASLMGAIKIAHAGTQNHALDRAGFEARFVETWGYRLAL